jgi:hypothetical protein
MRHQSAGAPNGGDASYDVETLPTLRRPDLGTDDRPDRYVTKPLAAPNAEEEARTVPISERASPTRPCEPDASTRAAPRFPDGARECSGARERSRSRRGLVRLTGAAAPLAFAAGAGVRLYDAGAAEVSRAPEALAPADTPATWSVRATLRDFPATGGAS